MVGLEVIPRVDEHERLVLEQALKALAAERVDSEPRAASSWWCAGALEAVGAVDADELELYALSPRKTRGATRA